MMTPEDVKKDPHWAAMRGVILEDLGITEMDIEEVVQNYYNKYGELKDIRSHAKNFLVRKALDEM